MYDDIDINAEYRRGWWAGALTVGFTITLTEAIVLWFLFVH